MLLMVDGLRGKDASSISPEVCRDIEKLGRFVFHHRQGRADENLNTAIYKLYRRNWPELRPKVVGCRSSSRVPTSLPLTDA